jgi:hypothetical protein
VPVGQGELFALIGYFGHDGREYALSRANAPRVSKKSLCGGWSRAAGA